MKHMILLVAAVGMVAATFAENRQPDKVPGAKPIVRLSVAYMAIGESDLRKIGNSQPATGDGALQQSGGVFDVLRDLVCGSNNCNTARVGTPLDITKRSFSLAGITRMSDTGHAFIESWSKDGVKIKSGGSVFVRMDGGKYRELREYAYGVMVDAKGGLVDDTTMDLYLDSNFSTIVPTKDDAYDCRSDISKQRIHCPIGQTTFVRTVDMIDKNTPPSGIRFLRTTPLLNWFVADSGKEVSDRRFVFMICPEIVGGTQDVPVSTDREINIRVPAPDLDANYDGCDGGKKFTGFWSWLNWFMF